MTSEEITKKLNDEDEDQNDDRSNQGNTVIIWLKTI